MAKRSARSVLPSSPASRETHQSKYAYSRVSEMQRPVGDHPRGQFPVLSELFTAYSRAFPVLKVRIPLAYASAMTESAGFPIMQPEYELRNSHLSKYSLPLWSAIVTRELTRSLTTSGLIIVCRGIRLRKVSHPLNTVRLVNVPS